MAGLFVHSQSVCLARHGRQLSVNYFKPCFYKYHFLLCSADSLGLEATLQICIRVVVLLSICIVLAIV